MSYYSDLPQTPRAKRSQQYEASPSSSSGNSNAEDLEAREQTRIFERENGILESRALAPASIDPGKGDGKSKYNANYSPLLHTLDPRSTSPLLYAPQDQACLSTVSSSGFHTFSMKNKLYYKMYHFWTSNRSYLLVIISTFFGSSMTLLTKLLERDGHGMHAFQILFLRMIVSWVVCIASLYYQKRSEFPFGPKDVRWLLLARGVFGFAGIGGLWTALSESP